jgi:hypothetical protein
MSPAFARIAVAVDANQNTAKERFSAIFKQSKVQAPSDG